MDSLIDCHNVGLKLGLEETFVLPVIGFVRVKQLKMFPNSFLGSQLIFINVFFFYKKFYIETTRQKIFLSKIHVKHNLILDIYQKVSLPSYAYDEIQN